MRVSGGRRFLPSAAAIRQLATPAAASVKGAMLEHAPQAPPFTQRWQHNIYRPAKHDSGSIAVDSWFVVATPAMPICRQYEQRRNSPDDFGQRHAPNIGRQPFSTGRLGNFVDGLNAWLRLMALQKFIVLCPAHRPTLFSSFVGVFTVDPDES